MRYRLIIEEHTQLEYFIELDDDMDIEECEDHELINEILETESGTVLSRNFDVFELEPADE